MNLLLGLCAAVFVAQGDGADELFARATPESQGLDSRWLQELGEVLAGWVEREHIVGAELAVIRNDRLVFHQGFGWRDREERVAMEPGGVFCLRSMTKPVVGTAAQVLLEQGTLALSARVAEHLPSFDNDRSRSITLENLLTHMSGLSLSSLQGQDLATLGGLRAIADLVGSSGPEFAPGSGFHYSDDGADVLGALVELVGGQELETLLRTRLFEPLGMHATVGDPTRDPDLRARMCTAYFGGPGEWKRHIGRGDPPQFPFLLASQGLYGTALDYAAFLRLWQRGGVVGSARMLTQDTLTRALAPRNRTRMPSGFRELERWYGEMMMVWIDPTAASGSPPVAFGHGGSDGTAAWVFPALNLTVLYFTQSRNTLTLIEFETELERYLLDPLRGRERAPVARYSSAELAAFVGAYWEADDQETQHILRRGDALWLEHPGKILVELSPLPQRDAFHIRLAPSTTLRFERAASGQIVAFTASRRGAQERMAFIQPSTDLPDVDDLLSRKRATLAEERLAELGPVRLHTTSSMPAMGLEGECEILFDGITRLASVCDYDGSREELVLNGGLGWARLPGAELDELDSARRFDALVEHPLLVAADWRALYANLAVLARATRDGREVLVVRGESPHGHAHTWTLDAQSGLPLELRTFVEIPGLGEIGLVIEFSDWRDVGPLRLPFHRAGRFAQVLGAFDVRWQEVEREFALDPEAAFARPNGD